MTGWFPRRTIAERKSHGIVAKWLTALYFITRSLRYPGREDNAFRRRQSISPSQLRLKCQTSPWASVRERERERGATWRFPLIRDIVTRVHVVTVRIRDEVTRYALCTHVNAAAPPSDVSAITPTMRWPSDEYRFVRNGDVDDRRCLVFSFSLIFFFF